MNRFKKCGISIEWRTGNKRNIMLIKTATWMNLENS
jgi:hypothetical protein